MSRKRFIKLMMANGYSRNCAAALAMSVSRYGSYAALYQRFAVRSVLQFDMEKLRRTIAMAFVGFSEACSCLSDAFARMGESMRRAAL